MFRYLVFCRVYPKSGLELAKHNKTLSMFESIVTSAQGEVDQTSESLLQALDRYKKENEGYVLELIPIVSDKKITDPEIELMPEISKEYPGAELIRYITVPDNSVGSTITQIVTENKFLD